MFIDDDCLMCGSPASANLIYCLGCSTCVTCGGPVVDNAFYCPNHYWGMLG